MTTGARPRWWRRWSPTLTKLPVIAIGAFAIALMFFAALVLSPELSKTVRVLRTFDWESPQWNVNHTEVEFHKYNNQLDRAILGAEPDLAALRQSFDIFYSRLEAIEVGEAAAHLREIPEFRETVQEVRREVDASAVIIDRPDSELVSRLDELEQSADIIYPEVRNLSLITLDDWATRTVGRRMELARTLDNLSLTLTTGVALLAVALAIMARLLLLGSRREAELEAARDRAIEGEDALRESEARFRRAADLAHLGHYTWDRHGRQITSFSPTFAEIHGFPVVEEDGGASCALEQVVARVHPDDRQRHRETLLDRPPAPDPFALEYRIVRPDGEVRHVLDIQAGVPERVEGAPVGEGVLLDITELRTAEEQLRTSEARLREAQSLARMGNWVVEDDGRLWWSEETYRLFQIDPEDFDGTISTFYSRVHPEDVELVRATARLAWDVPEPYDCTHRIVLPDGQIRVVRERAKPVPDASGATCRMIGTVQDITEQALAEEKLRRAQKMEAIGQLTGGVAHDFNNLLAVIMGNLELLRSSVTDAGLQELIDAGISAASRGAKLTQNMLSFAGRARLEPTAVDLNATIEELEGWAERMLPQNIDVRTSLGTGLWRVFADRTLTFNALLNIVLNARDAMPGGGRIAIATANVALTETLSVTTDDLPPGKYVTLTVSDTGYGMSEKDMARIFEPFFTTKPMGKGTGLGLSMVLGFMKQSGGGVQVRSEPGAGTVFTLYFRSTAGPAEADHGDARRRGGEVTRNARILLVEDQENVLRVFDRILRDAGYAVVTATTGEKAIEIFEMDRDFNLILTDSALPGKLQGRDVARTCRQIAPEVKTVFVSGHPASEVFEDAAEEPNDPWLIKPVRRKTLIDAIEGSLHPAE